MIENLPLILTGLGLTASIIYYTITLRNANKTQQIQLETRQAQLFMNVYSQLSTSEAMEHEYELQHIDLRNVEDWKNILSDKTRYMALNWYLTFYEGLGVLVRKELVSIDLVAQMISGNIIWFWEKYGAGFIQLRGDMNWPRAMIELEYLYERVTEYLKENHPDVNYESPNYYFENECAHARSESFLF